MGSACLGPGARTGADKQEIRIISDMAGMEQEQLNTHYRRLGQELQGGKGGENRKCWGQVEHEEGRRLYEDGGLSMARLLVELLKIVPEDTVVDLGAGPCKTAHQVTQLVQLHKPVLCVDPVAELLFQGSELHNIRILQADAAQFVKLDGIRYSKIYIKAAVHHFPKKQFDNIFKGIHSQLLPGGRLLIDTGVDTCYLPWGVRGTQEYNRSHSGHQDELEKVLARSGFKTRTYKLAIPATIDRKDLMTSYLNKYSTCFYSMTEREIEEEMLGLQKDHKEEMIRFMHERILILAGK